MKILHIVAGAARGGAETFCLDAIKALHAGAGDQKIEQYVICRNHEAFKTTLGTLGIGHEFLRFSRFTKWREQQKITRAVQSFQPDIVHCWMQRPASFLPSGIDAPRLGWFGGYYDLKNYKNCNFYMGVTRDIVRHINSHTGKPDRAFVVHTFGTLENDPPVSRADFDIPADAKVVLLLSRMHWKKGVDTLMEAALRLPGVYFLLAGDGPDLEKFKALARTLGVESRVRFPGWRTDRAALLGIADVCALPSRYEPFGTVIAEAWYAGVPLVATKADGARQYVTHGQDGLLCEIDDVAGLAQQLKLALYDKAVRDKIIDGGRATYEALFSRDVVIKTLVQAYQTMIDRHIAEKAAGKILRIVKHQ
jgi:glycosyltransferase involved in cell wall biosynthesis